jgi:hypothetical protein
LDASRDDRAGVGLAGVGSRCAHTPRKPGRHSRQCRRRPRPDRSHTSGRGEAIQRRLGRSPQICLGARRTPNVIGTKRRRIAELRQNVRCAARRAKVRVTWCAALRFFGDLSEPGADFNPGGWSGAARPTTVRAPADLTHPTDSNPRIFGMAALADFLLASRANVFSQGLRIHRASVASRNAGSARPAKPLDRDRDRVVARGVSTPHRRMAGVLGSGPSTRRDGLFRGRLCRCLDHHADPSVGHASVVDTE